MKIIEIEINKDDYKILNNKYPITGKSSIIGNRSVEIVKIYLKLEYPNCKIIEGENGADLRIISENNDFEIEIKGTSDKNVSYNKLKISSERSYNRIISGLPIYRVTNVFNIRPKIYILEYNNDFQIREEKRWCIIKK